MATKRISLTAEERTLILVALRIASEDGSIFSGDQDEDEDRRIKAHLERIEAKLQKRD